MKILITGGAGFIGSNLADALIEKSHSVTVLDDLSSGFEQNLNPKAEFIKGSVTDKELVNRLMKGKDYVFHLAAMISLPESIDNPVNTVEVNTIGTLNILKAAQNHKLKKAVIVSSAAVYGGAPECPTSEDCAINPENPYAITKFDAECYARMFARLGLPTVCLRLFNVYGPRQNPESLYAAVIPLFISRIARNESPVVFGDGKQTRDFMFVKDVVNALLLAGFNERLTNGESINIATGKEVEIIELVKVLNKIAGKYLKPLFEKPRKGDPKRSVGNPRKAEELLKFKPQNSLEQGLKETFEWFKQR